MRAVTIVRKSLSTEWDGEQGYFRLMVCFIPVVLPVPSFSHSTQILQTREFSKQNNPGTLLLEELFHPWR